MAYNPPAYGMEMMRGVALLLAGALTGCALASPPSRIVYQQGRTVVQLEADPSVGGMDVGGWNSHPAQIKTTQLAAILRGIQVRSEQGIVGTLLSFAAPADAVFTEEELALLTPVLADGLAQAGPSERVAFNLWSAQTGRRGSPLSGHVALREPYLRFGLNDHPTIGWQDPGDPSAPKLFELEFVRESYLLAGSEKERKATFRARPLIQIDYRRYLAYLQDQRTPAALAKEPAATVPSGASPRSTPDTATPRDSAKPDADMVKDLQRQVRELTDSNQELRAKLREALDRQDQSRVVNEELARLRQDLAETKQLLADKVLELNRLQNKPGGTDKGKR